MLSLEYWKDFDLHVIIKSMLVGFIWFLKQVFLSLAETFHSDIIWFYIETVYKSRVSYCLNYISKLITTSFKWLAVNFFITRASKEPFIFWFYFNEFFCIDKTKIVTRKKYLISLRKKQSFPLKLHSQVWDNFQQLKAL